MTEKLLRDRQYKVFDVAEKNTIFHLKKIRSWKKIEQNVENKRTSRRKETVKLQELLAGY